MQRAWLAPAGTAGTGVTIPACVPAPVSLMVTFSHRDPSAGLVPPLHAKGQGWHLPWGMCPSHDSKPDRGGRDCAPVGTWSPFVTATSPSLVPTAPTATSHRQRVPVRVWDPLPTVPRGHQMGRTDPVLNVSPPPTPAPERQVPGSSKVGARWVLHYETWGAGLVPLDARWTCKPWGG